jgi:U3 small nucleolar RNA-associated protein 12
VTVVVKSPDDKFVAAGYSDGKIRLWDLSSNECVVALSGHTSGISCLQFNRSGSLLVSGSNDTSVIVWDVSSERGLFRYVVDNHSTPSNPLLTTVARCGR